MSLGGSGRHGAALIGVVLATLALLAAVASSSAHAQGGTGTIAGTVTDEANGSALASICVDVLTLGGTDVAQGLTDASGAYSVGAIVPGDYKLEFRNCGSGAFEAEFFNDKASFGAADVLAVSAGQTATANAQLRANGTISGTVTGPTGDPVVEVCVEAFDANEIVAGIVSTDADGHYSISGLRTGFYKVRFSGCGSDSFIGEYYADKPTYELADAVGVSGGASVANIDAQLALGGSIAGTVTGPASEALGGICVYALTEGGQLVEGSSSEAATGEYRIENLASGSYQVQFQDCDSGDVAYATEYHDGAGTFAAADPVAVTVGQTSSGIDAQLALGGSITGTVTQGSGAPAAGICVLALETTNQSVEVAYGNTDANGDYTVEGLGTGSYKVYFFGDCASPQLPNEYYDDQEAFETATLVSVTAESVTANIDAVLDGGQAALVAITSGPSGPTNQARPVFTFSARPGTTVTCSIDTGSPSFAPCSGGNTSHQPAANLADGTYSFRVRGVDGAGNTVIATRTFTVDTQAPTLAITAGPTGPTSQKRPSFGFDAQPGSAVRCSINTGTPSFGACSGAATHVPASDLADASYVFRVRATDAAGNQTELQRAFSVDTTGPSLTIDAGPTGPTQDQRPSFTFSAEAGSPVECSVDSGTPAFGPCSGVSSHQPPTNLADGSYTFRVRAADALGNATVRTRSFNVDTAAPSLSIGSGPGGPTNEPRPTFGFSAEAGSTVECSIDTGAPAFGPCSGVSSHQPPTNLADGSYTFRVRAVDTAGTTVTQTRAFTVDTVVSPLAITGGPSGVTSDPRPTFSFDVEAGSPVECSIDTGTPSFSACSAASSHQPPANLADGSYTFRIRATDALGNTGTATVAFSVNTTPPPPPPPPPPDDPPDSEPPADDAACDAATAKLKQAKAKLKKAKKSGNPAKVKKAKAKLKKAKAAVADAC